MRISRSIFELSYKADKYYNFHLNSFVRLFCTLISRNIARNSFSNMSGTPFKQAEHKLTMIPGPIEFSDAVLYGMATPSQAHTSPEFAKTFQSALQNLRKIFRSNDKNGQPYVLAGSGTLGWDVAASNLVKPGEKVLVLSTGFFSDSFADCLGVYGADVDVLRAEVGDVVPLEKVAEKLKSTKYAAITVTHVDTSSAVVSDVKKLSELVKKESPETLIFVDGVCSIAVEDFEFDKWGIDFALTASQKALGVPAGLSIFNVSERALDKALKREKESSFFASLKRWTPIMKAYESGSAAYFATPAVQTVTALKISLNEILSESLEDRFRKHDEVAKNFRKTIGEWGLKTVPHSEDISARGLTAIYFPEGINGPELLSKVAGKGFTVAAGVHKALLGKYFRVGHMGYSIYQGHTEKLLGALKEALSELGYKF